MSRLSRRLSEVPADLALIRPVNHGGLGGFGSDSIAMIDTVARCIYFVKSPETLTMSDDTGATHLGLSLPTADLHAP